MSVSLPRTRIITKHGFDIRTRTSREITITISDDMAECLAHQIENYVVGETEDARDLRSFGECLDEAIR